MLQPTHLVVLRARLAGHAFELAAVRLQLLLRKANFNPGQVRDELGRWVGEGGGGAVHRVQNTGRPGYPINILEEDALGGHTFERHVEKPEEYLRARILGSRRNIPLIGGYGEKRAGSFTSLEAANKLVNSTLSQNQARIDAFVQGRFPMSLPFMYARGLRIGIR